MFFFGFIAIDEYYYGDYKINNMWIGNESNGVRYCNDCLWIEFDEGCNRYKTYYFENQHEFDNRLKIGQPVDISFSNNGYVRHLSPRIKYRRCS